MTLLSTRAAPALAALLLPALLGACAPTFALIAVNTPGDQGFKARIAQTYPPGSDPASLRAELAGQGFTIVADPAGRPRYSAILRGGNIPCLSYTRVDWNEDRRGRIAVIQAERLAV